MYLGSTAQTIVFSDNFDSYAAETLLLLQNSTDWTNWSQTPGANDDAMVSADIAFSAPNSLKITGTNDILHRFDDLTAGHYLVSFKWYIVASGNGAYFNMLHLFNGTSSKWAFECYADPNGNAILVVEGIENSFTFIPNNWLDIQLDVNLDVDSISMFMNESLIKKWQFSCDAGTTTPYQNKLAALNFYAGCFDNWQGGTKFGTYYVDDVVVIDANEIPSSIHESSTTSLSYFPNPVVDKLTVQSMNETIIKKIQLYDFSGRIIKEIETNAASCVVNLQDVSAGFYLIKIIDNQGNKKIDKLVKK